MAREVKGDPPYVIVYNDAAGPDSDSAFRDTLDQFEAVVMVVQYVVTPAAIVFGLVGYLLGRRTRG